MIAGIVTLSVVKPQAAGERVRNTTINPEGVKGRQRSIRCNWN